MPIMKIIQLVGILILFAFFWLGVVWCGYKLERRINWKFSYAAEVEQVVKPLGDRLEQLEKRIEILESQGK